MFLAKAAVTMGTGYLLKNAVEGYPMMSVFSELPPPNYLADPEAACGM